MDHLNRVVLLVDVDCFYCQVEEQMDPNLKGKPIGVVQFTNPWRGGDIIAANYLARDLGMTKHMRGDDARKKCPDVKLVQVPIVRGKADLSRYREAGKKVAEVLQTFTLLLERASVDEAYLDVTQLVEQRMNNYTQGIDIQSVPNTYVVGYSTDEFLRNTFENGCFSSGNVKLAIGAIIAEEIRADVFAKTGYKCSAGIAHNKILAKVACGLNKPNKQTVLPHEAVPTFYETLPIKKIRSLGGKLGNTVSEKLGITYMGELTKYSEKQLIEKFDEKTGTWLYNISKGIDQEPVTKRLVSKSIACCKDFPRQSALTKAKDVEYWINEIAQEIAERLQKDVEEYNRRAKQMVVIFGQLSGNSSRTHPLNSYDSSKIREIALNIIRKSCMKADGSYHVTLLGISVGKFEEIKKVKEITSFFKTADKFASRNKPHTSNPRESEETIAKSTTRSDLNKQEASPSKCSLEFLRQEFAKNDATTSNKHDNCENVNECSIWSTETVNLDLDPKTLKFYSEDAPHAVRSNKENINMNDRLLISGNIEVQSTCFVSNNNKQEPCNTSITSQTIESRKPLSFFQRYFKSLEERNRCKSPLDTSGISIDSTEINNINENETSKVCVVNETVDGNSREDANSGIVGKSSTAEQLGNRNFGEKANSNEHCNKYSSTQTTCQECGKLVPTDQIVSHMDYHYALQIVKEEVNLYKPDSKSKPTVSSKDKKPAKRKTIINENTSIKTFLQVETVPIEESEVCSVCSKRIRFSEIESHMDYHAAKKLHSELNAVNSVPANKSQKSATKSTNKGSVVEKPVNRSVKTISAFFKPI